MCSIDIKKTIEKLAVPFDMGDGNNNVVAANLANHIYDCFIGSKRERTEKIPVTGNLLNCKSSNFKAIAEAHMFTYQTLSAKNDPNAAKYLEDWVKFDALAREASNIELNVRVNKFWKDKRFNGKELWKAVDWKGRVEEQVEKMAHEADTMKYFSSISNPRKQKITQQSQM